MTTNPWWHPLGNFGDATVWYVELAQCSRRAASAYDWLDSRERERSQRFIHPLPECQFVLTRAALRILLCRWLRIPNRKLAFETSAHGKPFALVDKVPAEVSFNVSHSGTHGLIAVAGQGRLGADVEERSVPFDVDKLGEIVFTPGERADIAKGYGQQRIDRFLTVWTAKEALLKALGTGLSGDPRALEIPRELRHGKTSVVFRPPGTPGSEWRLDTFGNSDYACALARELVPGAVWCAADRLANRVPGAA